MWMVCSCSSFCRWVLTRWDLSSNLICFKLPGPRVQHGVSMWYKGPSLAFSNPEAQFADVFTSWNAGFSVCTWQVPNSFTRGPNLGFYFCCFIGKKSDNKQNPKHQPFPWGDLTLEQNRVWKSPGFSKPQGWDLGGQRTGFSLQGAVSSLRNVPRIQRTTMGSLQDPLAWSSRLFICLCFGVWGGLIKSLHVIQSDLALMFPCWVSSLFSVWARLTQQPYQQAKNTNAA